MSVFKRVSPSGKETPLYHYQFRVQGKLYRGVCRDEEGQGCRLKRDAQAAEKRERERVLRLTQQKSVKALVENFARDLAGGESISLGDAWDRFMGKPRRRPMGERHEAMVRARWGDFLAFMRDSYPERQRLGDITRRIAREYVAEVRANGPWGDRVAEELARAVDVPPQTIKRYMNRPDFPRERTVGAVTAWIAEQTHGMRKKHVRKRRRFTPRKTVALSTQTKNNYLTTCHMVFEVLGEDAGLTENPFAGIPKVENQPTEREAFTPEELRLIGESAKGWFYSLFLVGINTGLREGDICLLRWREVDLRGGWIKRRMRKTGKVVDVPILPALADHLGALPQDSEYCFPELAERYTTKRTTIGQAVSEFLASLGIETTRQVEGRSRAVSVKDVHSCRHTFCYVAALHGVPLPIVQSIVGHMSDEMTKRYMNHAQREDKRRALAAVPNYLAGERKGLARGEPERQQLRDLANTLPIADVRRALALLVQP